MPIAWVSITSLEKIYGRKVLQIKLKNQTNSGLFPIKNKPSLTSLMMAKIRLASSSSPVVKFKQLLIRLEFVSSLQVTPYCFYKFNFFRAKEPPQRGSFAVCGSYFSNTIFMVLEKLPATNL